MNRRPVVIAAFVFGLTAVTVHAQSMVIMRGGSRPVQQGPSATFTGTARVTPLFDATESSRLSGASVSFDAGARSAWHTHPRGQILIVTAGTGRVQQEGGAVEEIRSGDVVWTPPGVKHWHGASPTTALTHIAIQESADGKAVEWMEKVSDAQYQVAPRAAPTSKSDRMSDTPSDARKSFGDIAPALADYTDQVLFGDLWKRTDLSPRDRSLVTVTALVAGYRTNELPYHLKKALDNGVSRDEVIGLITHLAFYSGWPTANTALPIARRVFEEADSQDRSNR
jgi:4-carboxymuconolactone decarboxylase